MITSACAKLPLVVHVRPVVKKSSASSSSTWVRVVFTKSTGYWKSLLAIVSRRIIINYKFFSPGWWIQVRGQGCSAPCESQPLRSLWAPWEVNRAESFRLWISQPMPFIPWHSHDTSYFENSGFGCLKSWHRYLGTVILPRQTDVGILFAYPQLFIQPCIVKSIIPETFPF